MDKCLTHGCRNLQTKCMDCGRVVLTATFPERNEWISIKDRLPKEDIWIIGGNSSRVEFGIYLGQEMGFCLPNLGYMQLEMTHWMPLPSPPKE